ncbi:MAG: hypothetical protein PHP98_09790 [Kiritimatiellae bacterium]|jgi:hypothetical protein|nr:hypothetical protein [Kiritimatiellia bacterium]
MKKVNDREIEDDLRPEYDLSKLKGGARGKYAKRFQQGTNLVLLSPDVARYFPDEHSVNAVLRLLVGIAKTIWPLRPKRRRVPSLCAKERKRSHE